MRLLFFYSEMTLRTEIYFLEGYFLGYLVLPFIFNHRLNIKSSKLANFPQSDDYGAIHLYKYPAVVSKQVNKQYQAHSSGVSRIRFSYDNKYVISIGSQDRTILIWECDYTKNELPEYVTKNYEHGALSSRSATLRGRQSTLGSLSGFPLVSRSLSPSPTERMGVQ